MLYKYLRVQEVLLVPVRTLCMTYHEHIIHLLVQGKNYSGTADGFWTAVADLKEIMCSDLLAFSMEMPNVGTSLKIPTY